MVVSHNPTDPDALFREHARFVANFAIRMGVSTADVDDVVQEVFFVAHRCGGYDPARGQARGWLAAIALRACCSYGRRRARRAREVAGALDQVACPDNLDGRIAARAELVRVERALERLTPKQRAAFVLFEIEGLPCTEIAVALAMPIGTVYSRLDAARRRFQIEFAALTMAQPSCSLPAVPKVMLL